MSRIYKFHKQKLNENSKRNVETTDSANIILLQNKLLRGGMLFNMLKPTQIWCSYFDGMKEDITNIMHTFELYGFVYLIYFAYLTK